MKVPLRTALVSGILALVAPATIAQTEPSECTPPEKLFNIMDVSSRLGCPFSAVIETQRIRTLADGTHIRTTSKAVVFRDSLSRIRYEMYGSESTKKETTEVPNSVHILDPVAGFAYHLVPETSEAYRSKLVVVEWRPKASAEAHSTSSPNSNRPPPNGPAARPAAEQLGSQQIEGILATGRRTSRTLPIGSEGNDRPITLASEIWESLDMGIRLLEKISDPRFGDIERRMTNLQRSEPDPALFDVPANYTIKDQ